MTEYVNETNLAEYEAFVQNHPKGTFMQSALWAKQKPAWTWKAIICRGNDGKIRGSIAFLIRKMPVVRRPMLYGCRGPVCDLDDRETFAELMTAARRLAAEQHAYVIKIDPDVPSSETAFAQMLEDNGFCRRDLGKNFEAVQPRYVFRLYLNGRNEEEMLASFQQKWRYNIRLAVKKGVEIRICGKEMVPEFSRIMVETGVRDHFAVRPAEYFSAMLDNLGEHARLYMAFYEDKPIAGTLAIHHGDKVWYLYGGRLRPGAVCMISAAYRVTWTKTVRITDCTASRRASAVSLRSLSANMTMCSAGPRNLSRKRAAWHLNGSYRVYSAGSTENRPGRTRNECLYCRAGRSPA